MNSVGAHVVERLMSATVESYPYPHFFVDNVFPEDFYRELMSRLPSDDELILDSEAAYGLDLAADGLARFEDSKKIFWDDLLDWLLDPSFMNSMTTKLYPHLKLRFFDRNDVVLTSNATFGRSKPGWVLGPHTDLPHRVMTVLFYLPETDQCWEAGTSIYRPRDESFKCVGGPHYGFEDFQKLATMRFLPNMAFGFLKSDISFHGVEPWTVPGFNRDKLQYEVHDSDRAFYYG